MAVAKHGYAYGDPFGDPTKFTASTGDDEINRFNQWMRAQPWHQQFIARTKNKGKGDLTDTEQAQLSALTAKELGLPFNSDYDEEIDKAGNLHGKSWRERHPTAFKAAIAAGVAAGGYFAAPLLAAGTIGSGTSGAIATGALHGAELGAATGGAYGGATGGWKGALKGAGMGALTGAATGGLGAALPKGGGYGGSIGRSAARGAVGSAVRGQNPLYGAATGGASAASPTIPGQGIEKTLLNQALRSSFGGAASSAIRGRNPLGGAWNTVSRGTPNSVEDMLFNRATSARQ